MMIRNYIIIALRNLSKNIVFSFINIAGLGIGLACVVVIFAYVRLELSYDRFHPGSENIYRITTEWINDGVKEHTAHNHSPLAPLLTENLGGLKKVVRIFPLSGLVSIDQVSKTRENPFCFADSTFFDVFNFNAIDGSLAGALDQPMSVVITKSAAIKYFGSTHVAGKELFFEDNIRNTRFNVAAVIEDMPENGHFNFNFIGSFATLQTLWPRALEAWHYPPMYIYAQMTEGQTAVDINAQLSKIADKHLPDYVKAEERSFFAQRITDIHLQSDLQNEWQANSNYTYIQIFSTIAFFILLIACINYMNLATAKSAQRAAEVGIRKAMGSVRNQLVRMFIGESLVTTTVAIIVGLGLAQLAMSTVFKTLLSKELSIGFLFQWPYAGYLVIGWLVVSGLAGVYPAFYLSSFSPVRALKGKAERSGSVLGLRKGLVVLQFFISALLLVGTFVVIRQVDFMRNKELGFDEAHILTIMLHDRENQRNYLVFKNKLLQESFVENVTVSAALPSGEGFYGWEVVPEGFEDRTQMVIKSVNTDEDFLKTYAIKLLSGRDFSKDIITDREQAFIINEALARKLLWDDPVGKEIQLTFYTNDAVVRKGKVIGLAEDFHFQSLYNRIEPLVILINTHEYYSDFISVRLSAGNLQSQVDALQSVWNSFSPDKPFEYSFLDEDLNNLYGNEQKTSRLLAIFTGLSVIISCLGLFGLASFSVQQRTKEIGIRKVLGASEFSILHLLSREFVLLVFVANLLAWPAAWYGANQWLSRFAYHTEMSTVVFVLALTIILAITLLTVGWQSLRAAIDNPVNSLRYE